MSFKVLVIPEDPTLNGYILKPLIEAVIEDAGKPKAKVTVLTNPRLEGYEHAVTEIRADALAERYGFWDMWIFVPDADRATPEIMVQLERDLAAKNVTLICSPAEPEVEIYTCVGYRKEISCGWEAARRHPRFKEEVFAPLLKKHGDPRRTGSGRDLMISQTLTNRAAMYQLCPELERLRQRLSEIIERS